jgi:hypothetical protein
MLGYGTTGFATAALVTARKAGTARAVSLAATLLRTFIVSARRSAARKEPFSPSSVAFTNTIARIVLSPH